MRARICYGILCGVVGVLLTIGCADKPKPMPQPTPAQTRSDSDRFFDKMKQDERDQGRGTIPAH